MDDPRVDALDDHVAIGLQVKGHKGVDAIAALEGAPQLVPTREQATVVNDRKRGRGFDGALPHGRVLPWWPGTWPNTPLQ